MIEETRTAICSECKKTYEEKDQDCFHFIGEGVPMLCYECCKQYFIEFENRINNAV